MSFGTALYRHRWTLLIAWTLVTLAFVIFAPWPDLSAGETTDILPADTPSHRAIDEITRRFAGKIGLSQAAIVFERSDAPLTPRDLQDINAVATDLTAFYAHQPPDQPISLLTPQTFAFLPAHNPFISPDNRAALILINIPHNFVTTQAARVVDHARGTLDHRAFSPGLTAAITGSAGFGHDYSLALERGHHKTLAITLLAVVIILLIVYRAPLAAAIPLLAIGMAAAVTVKLLTLAEPLGLHSGTAERIFVLVLLYGAGIDYSLLFMSRYSEFLDAGHPHPDALARGLSASVVAIISSALMTISGLAMLCFAHFSVFRNVGPAVVLALLLAALASITLVPAALAIVGRRAFWPGRRSRANAPPKSRRSLWEPIAAAVVRRPALILSLTAALLLLPALRGANLTWDYNSMASLAPTYDAPRGAQIVTRHWPVGETAPLTLLFTAESPLPLDAWTKLADTLVARLRALPDIDNVRSLRSPLGLAATPAENSAIQFLAAEKIRNEYLSDDRRAMKLSLVFNIGPLTRTAMNDLPAIRAAAESAAADARLPLQLHLAGATPEIVDIRSITQRDFYLIAALALAAILALVLGLLRDPLLSLFMVAATVLSYFTTLGLTYWTFAALGESALEWKVQVFLFIVLIAVGQDYSLFFIVRLAQETIDRPLPDATRAALVHTGPVISSCGLIMAATLGSVMAGDIKLLIQLGFAFALGMLLDTFIVRPLLLPAFIILTRRSLKRTAPFARSAH